MTARRARGARRRRSAPDAPTPPASVPTFMPWLVPAGLITGLVALTLTPRVHDVPLLRWACASAAAALALWLGVLWIAARRQAAPPPALERAARPQHYVQALVQLSVFLYWGWYWSPVADHAWLIVAQLLFAYAFDLLLGWSRRGRYQLGFGPFPIIFSTNLFLWFRDDWFGLQFLMIAVGFLGKEFIRWNRNGRRVHIFNPSAFALGIVSLALVATGSTSITWGEEIATTLTLAPAIYAFLFATGLVVMYFFSITLIAGTAAVTLFALSAGYGAATGVPYFVDSEIPTAVFLGLHLLVTDPSTSPRTPLGKTGFGVLYGLTVFALYAALGAAGVPTFYDKLLSVPLLNLSVPWIDRLAARFPSAGPAATPAANLRHMAVWSAVFGTMTVIGATDGRHRGDRIPFWQQACAEGRRHACARLLQLETSYCADASAWACHELGRHYTTGRLIPADPDVAFRYFARACELRFQAACVAVLRPEAIHTADPKPLDLRLLLREGGANLMTMPEPALYTRACAHGWTFACRAGDTAARRDD